MRSGTVAVTGAATEPGAGFLAWLASDWPGKVIGLDQERGRSYPHLLAALSDVVSLVHLDFDASPSSEAETRRSANLGAAQTALSAAAAAGLGRVVLVTSAMVYGAHSDNPVPLREEAPLRGAADRSVVGDWLAIERMADDSAQTHPGMRLTVLRPAIVVGPGADTAITRAFAAPRLLVLKGTRPRWQFCHVDDLFAAIGYALRGGVDSPATVGCAGWLEQGDVERVSGMRHLELSSQVAFAAAERLHRIGVTPAPASELRYLAHPWVISSERLRAAGWLPRYSNEEALADHLANAPVGSGRFERKDATRAAAGATVAFAGAVAITRARARRRRKRR